MSDSEGTEEQRHKGTEFKKNIRKVFILFFYFVPLLLCASVPSLLKR